jgi:hypothetical protein
MVVSHPVTSLLVLTIGQLPPTPSTLPSATHRLDSGGITVADALELPRAAAVENAGPWPECQGGIGAIARYVRGR